jgi:hypothetical protein
MLREVVFPELENSLLYDNTEIIWQQDGASPFENSLMTAVWSGSDGVVQLNAPPLPIM